MFSCCLRWRSRSLANSSGERCGVCSLFWALAMAPFHAGAWWAARLSRVIAPITLAASQLLLRDVDAGGYLDIELVYRLRQKESLGSVKQKIVRKIQQNVSTVCFEDSVRDALEIFNSRKKIKHHSMALQMISR